MMHYLPRMTCLLLVLLLGACQTYTLLQPGPITAGGLQMNANTQWVKVQLDPLNSTDLRTSLTRDGQGLGSVYIVAGVADGDTIYPTPEGSAPTTAPFRSSMDDLEIEELISSSLRRYISGELKTLRVAPAQFAGHTGFEVEYAFTNDDSQLDMRQLIRGAKINNKLYVIVYTAPALTYFERNLAATRALMDSARLQGS